MLNGLIPSPWRLRVGFFLALTACVIVAMTVSGSADAGASKSAACSGTPIKIEAIANISNAAGSQQSPEFPQAIKAAALALTKSCQLGGPVQVIVCDDKFNPNDAAACGRDVVKNKPMAVFTYSGFGDSFVPIISAAGIPTIPVVAVGQEEVTNPLSFGLAFSMVSLIGQLNAAASAGHKKLAINVLDLPAVAFIMDIAEAKAKGLGMTLVKKIPVSVTESDMSGIAAQDISSGATVMLDIIGPAQHVGVIQAVRQQGATSKQLAFATAGNGAQPKTLKALGGAASGLLISSWVWYASDPTSKPYVRQMISELKAAGQPSGPLDVTDLTRTAWGGLHMLADAFTAAKLKPTAANVPKALKQKAVFKLSQAWGLNPLDYSGSQFPTDPVLKNLRLFTKYHAVFQVNSKGQVVPLSQKWLSVLHKTKLTPVN
jgi:ABC-type branched-subunit amino acid transport system substrate-binding protein